MASDRNGNVVIVWQSAGPDGSGFGIFGQRFDAAGDPRGGEFQVNSFTTGYQARPSVASDANGNFVVAWHSAAQDGSSYGAFGQRFDAAGDPRGAEFQVNSFTTGVQFGPVVASASNGNFVLAWASALQDGSSFGVFGQRFGDIIFKDGFN